MIKMESLEFPVVHLLHPIMPILVFVLVLFAPFTMLFIFCSGNKMQNEFPTTTDNGTHLCQPKRKCLVCCLHKKKGNACSARTELVQTTGCLVMK